MTYDFARQRVILFGGDGGDFTPALNDTWEWEGTSWTQRFPPNVPPARNEHALVYDSARRRVVLFGGRSCLPFQGCTPLADTWEWNGSDWTSITASGPPGRAFYGAAYDFLRSRTVLFGGLGSGVLGDFWEWNGTSWSERSSPVGPAARYSPALAFDPFPGRSLMFGGVDADFHVTSETWELAVPCDTLGPGHASGSLAIACSAEPRIGTSFCVGFSDPASGGAHGLLAGLSPSRSVLPVNLPSLCLPGLLYVPSPFQSFRGTGDPARYCITLSPSPSLVGASFVLQGAVRETSGCWRLTDGLVLTIQP
jgi:hypothetical protein